jgi:hypothetical protein
MKRYVAECTPSGVEVLVQHSDAPGDESPLNQPPGWTPGGFEWGYQGAGPRRLAYAILTDLIADRFGDAFMEEVVSKVSPIEEHQKVVVFHEEKILDWLRGKLGAG